MRRLRLLVIAVGCLVAGPVLVIRFLGALPELEELERVSGPVYFDTETRRSRRSSTEYPVLQIGASSMRYKYLDWFPRSDDLPDLLQVGETVTIWTDRGENDWVWQIEKGGEIVIAFADIRAAVASNRRFDWLIGAGVFLLGIWSAVMLIRGRRRGGDPGDPTPNAHTPPAV